MYAFFLWLDAAITEYLLNNMAALIAGFAAPHDDTLL